MKWLIGTPGWMRGLAIVMALVACVFATPHAQAAILLHESFGFGTNSIRLDSAGSNKFIGAGIDLGGTQIEFPSNTVSWTVQGGHQAQTWQSSASSLDSYEPPSPLEPSLNLEVKGCL